MSLRPLLASLLAATLAATMLAAAPAVPDAGFEPSPDRWAPVGTATIYPSKYLRTGGAGCTSNFIFEQFTPKADGTVVRDLFIGYAAHCAGKGGSTDTNGCLAGSQPIGTQVQIDGASKPGVLAYSAWETMIRKGQATNTDECKYNDFALVRIDPADHAKVNPSLPFFGGPTGIGGPSKLGEDLYTVGNSSLRAGITQLGPKYEISTGMTGNGWNHRTYAVSPGIPGDSGSGHVDAAGRAMGVTSTLALAPYAGSNGILDLAKALDYLAKNSSFRVELALGTQPFDSRLP